MKLDQQAARSRLESADHGVLCTVHAERGVDPVPVAFVVDDGCVGIPVDRVKSKSTTRLQRHRNLEGDPRAALLVERWDLDDWSQLWWVRAELRWLPAPSSELTVRLSTRLSTKYRQYANKPFDYVLAFETRSIAGWAAE